MRLTQFRTADLPPGDRFAAWHHLTASAHVGTATSPHSETGFAATISLVDLDTVQVSMMSYPALRTNRSARLIRQSDPGVYMLSVPRTGRMRADHAGQQASVGESECLLLDSSRPGVVVNNAALKQLVIQVPKDRFPLPPRQVERILNRPLPVDRGAGSLVTTFAEQLLVSARECAPGDGAALAAVTTDLVACFLAGQLNEPTAAGDSRQRLLWTRVLDFIERRLGDPALAPAAIAAAHQISLRYLHVLFQAQGVTVAGWIRERRLDRCRRDLADPVLDARPVHAIGRRWGFADATAFSRTFRRAFGLPPGDYRRNQQLSRQLR